MKKPAYHFAPEEQEGQLTHLLRDLLAAQGLDATSYESVLRRHPRPEGGFFSKSEIISGFRYLNRKLGWNLDERPILETLKMKPIRTQSGVAPVTVLTKPFPCPGECIFCPSDVRMPKSYLSSEPGAQRAAQHRFQPFEQTLSRLMTYHHIGHHPDKVELIVLGGTWSSYPEDYQIWFIRRCFDAMNRFRPNSGSVSSYRPAPRALDFTRNRTRVHGDEVGDSYNQAVTGFLRRHDALHPGHESASWAELESAQVENESAKARCVGLVLETRPDSLDLEEVIRLRRLGATKIQIGFQSLSDRVLQLNRRGHGVRETRRAMRLLRQAGFKIHAHWMPNLYGSSPAEDIREFESIFRDPDFRPDELKIYPCSLVESADLMSVYRRRLWHPYSHEELLHVVAECVRRTPAYCRLSRVIRDIPGTEIVDGSRVTNLRQVAEEHLRRSGFQPVEIRSREIRHRSIDPCELDLEKLQYDTNLGREIFLQFVTASGRLAAFLRLSLPSRGVEIAEIRDSAMIREVHVYGTLASLRQRSGLRSQHLGLGRRLIQQATDLARHAGYRDLAVVSAVGTREYYRSLAFTDGDLYQHRQL